MSPNARKAVEMVGPNFLLIVGLYFSIFESIAWAQYLTIGFIWTMLLAYLVAALSPEARTKYRNRAQLKVYLIVGDFFDVAVVAALIAFQWYWTAIAYGASAVVQRVVYGRIAFRNIKGS